MAYYCEVEIDRVRVMFDFVDNVVCDVVLYTVKHAGAMFYFCELEMINCVQTMSSPHLRSE